MNIIIFGPQGSGKGTQSSLIKEKYNIAHISTGDLFRENIKNQTELGKLAQTYINKGELVPDQVTINMLQDRIKKSDCKNGFILDGFPRNIPQAEALEKIVNIDAVILLDLDRKVLINRMLNRRTCRQCAHITSTDWLDGKTVCPKCGGELYQRDDDVLEAINTRLENYDKQTKPLIEFYGKKGILGTVKGQDKVEDTFALVDKEIQNLIRGK